MTRKDLAAIETAWTVTAAAVVFSRMIPSVTPSTESTAAMIAAVDDCELRATPAHNEACTSTSVSRSRPSDAAAALVTSVHPATRSTISVSAPAAAGITPFSTDTIVAVALPVASSVPSAVSANMSPAAVRARRPCPIVVPAVPVSVTVTVDFAAWRRGMNRIEPRSST